MEHLLQGLRRYFPSVDNLASASPLFLMRCLLFRSDDLLSGFAVIYEGRLLTFTDDDCLVADIRQGNPRVGLLEDVSECSVQSPSGFPVPSTTYVRHEPIPSPRSDAVSILCSGELAPEFKSPQRTIRSSPDRRPSQWSPARIAAWRRRSPRVRPKWVLIT